VLLPVVLERYGAAAEPRLAKLAKLIGLEGASDHELALSFIAEIRNLADSMGIPRTIPEIREEDIPQLAAEAESEGNPAYPVPTIWKREDFEDVLRMVSCRAEADSGAEEETTGLDAVGSAEQFDASDQGKVLPTPKRPINKKRVAAVSAGVAASAAIGAIAITSRSKRRG
jgi:hypothetical protein